MKLVTQKILSTEQVTKVNSVAKDVAMTISSQAPRSVPTEIVSNNLVKVQSIGSEIGINNLPTSAAQLKHKVIKACEGKDCNVIELTSKYNFKTSFQKYNKVLCRICAQNTEAENERRATLQIARMKDPAYKANSLKAILGPAEAFEAKILHFCERKGIKREDFTGFRRMSEGPRRDYAPEFTALLRRQIRKRDQNTCQMCPKTGAENGRALDVHHIDFDKYNNRQTNLVALCQVCHSSIKFAEQDCNVKLKIYAELAGNCKK